MLVHATLQATRKSKTCGCDGVVTGCDDRLLHKIMNNVLDLEILMM